MTDTLCPFCGASSTRQCESINDPDYGVCYWDICGDEIREPDQDILRDDRDKRKRLEGEYPDEE